MARTSQRRIPFAREFLRLGFGEVVDDDAPFYSHHFLTQELSTEEAMAVIPVVEQYNKFNGQRVADAIASFNGRLSGWKFGCAGSPLLVAVLASWTGQVENTKPGGAAGRKFTAEEHEALVDELRRVLVGDLAADKFERQAESSFEYGAWWD